MKIAYFIQSILHVFVGIGALFGGTMAIIDPYGVMYGMPVEVLKRGPFTSFLIPGLFLFFIIGGGHLLAFAAVKRSFKYHPYISGCAGGILVVWILIQCYVIQSIHFLHVIFFVMGAAEGLIALYMLMKLKLFPFHNRKRSFLYDSK